MRMDPSIGAGMTAIYHITHIDNLAAIIARGELLSDSLIRSEGVDPRNIAYAHIKQRRAAFAVQIPPGGTVADYVPFYFCPRSPMLYAVHGGKVEGYPGGQRSVLHLELDAEALVASGATCVHTDGHATMRLSTFFPGVAGLAQLDWPLIGATSWGDTPEDGDRKRRKQAEFLVHRRVPWSRVSRIGVIDATIADEVRQRLAHAAHQPQIDVLRHWYYP